jgi:hypothetical protein
LNDSEYTEERKKKKKTGTREVSFDFYKNPGTGGS